MKVEECTCLWYMRILQSSSWLKSVVQRRFANYTQTPDLLLYKFLQFYMKISDGWYLIFLGTKIKVSKLNKKIK